VGRPRLRPTMDEGLYDSLKNLANSTIPMSKVAEPGKGGATDAPAPAPQAPAVLKGLNINGPAESGWNPPDTHGAVGPLHYVAVTNSRILRYNKAGTLLNNSTLAAFFGYTTKGVFDPRAIYDKLSSRWFIVAEAFEESPTVQRFFIAVSKTSDAMGAYWIYKFDINILNNTDFFDYPQIGVDKNDIIVTGSIFGAGGGPYRGGRIYAFPKATLMAGGTVTFTQYSAAFLNQGTIAPPVVLDAAAANSFLMTAPNGGSTLRLYKLADVAPRVTFYGTVPVATFTVPPDAPQVAACTSQKLDTVDSRFVNASTQVGTSLFNAHTVSLSGFAAGRYYEVNTATKTLVRTANIFKSSTSHDFNFSIAANSAKDMVVVWTATDPALNTQTQVRFAGRRAADPNSLGAGVSLFVSPYCHKEGTGTVLRWGDYSAVSVDPSNPLYFWVINQKMNSQTLWGSRIARVGF
jgi:hypothetical protein